MCWEATGMMVNPLSLPIHRALSRWWVCLNSYQSGNNYLAERQPASAETHEHGGKRQTHAQGGAAAGRKIGAGKRRAEGKRQAP